jgi:putative nucleotidyltransferase-like protein
VSRPLPNIFPKLGRTIDFVLFSDFYRDPPDQDGLDWPADLETIISHGLAGLALRVIRERSVSVPSSVVDRLQRSQFTDMQSTAHVVRNSEAGLDCLRSASIPFVLTKGPGMAVHSAAVSDRPYVDLDVVVSPSRFMEALKVLREHEFVENTVTMEPWDSFNRFCREAINLRNGNGGSIDLHHRVSPWYWSGGLSVDLLLKSSQNADVFGVELPLASAPLNLMVAALHVVSDRGRPGQTFKVWRDILVLTHSCSIDVVVECAHETKLTAWLKWILGNFPVELQPAELIDALSRDPQRSPGQARLRSLLPPRIGAQHPIFGRMIRIPLPQAAVFTAGTLVPSPSYLRLRYPDSTHRYLKWWRESPQNFRAEPATQATLR